MKFAVRIIKNTFQPLKVPDGAHLHHGQKVLVRTEKGEEVFSVFIVNSQIMQQWQKFKPEALPLIRTINENDRAALEEQKKREVEAFFKCKALV